MAEILIKGTLIDGNGGEPVDDGVVWIDDNKITYAGDQRGTELPSDVPVIEVENGTILPGFVEQHCHLIGLGTVNTMEWYLQSIQELTCQTIVDCSALLDAGFTSARDVGGFGHKIRLSIEKGIVRGPRISSSGSVMTQTGGHGDLFQKFPLEFCRQVGFAHIVDGVDACRAAARSTFRDGADFLKIMTTGGITSQGDVNTHTHYCLDEIRVFVEEAKHHDTYVATHAQGTQGIKNALLGGVISIEHGIFLDDECIDLMLKIGAYLVPTFSIVQKYMDLLDHLPPWIVPKVTAGHEAHYESVAMAHKAGVKIGLGADFLSDPVICPYGANGMEFGLLVKAGLSPMDAIVAGTRTGSELMQMADDIGTLEAGKLADIVVVSGDPLADISILADPDRIKLVMKDGKVEKSIA